MKLRFVVVFGFFLAYPLLVGFWVLFVVWLFCLCVACLFLIPSLKGLLRLFLIIVGFASLLIFCLWCTSGLWSVGDFGGVDYYFMECYYNLKHILHV